MSEHCGLPHIDTPFWQRQPVLPLEIQRFLRRRVEAALHDPGQRQALAWATVLGAPAVRAQFPEGLPENLLLAHAAKMLAAVGVRDPERAWAEHLADYPDAAKPGAAGWMPHDSWGAWGPLVSLRSGWQLAALTPLDADARYGVACGVSLFNHALFHECHDALEPAWMEASGELKAGLQGLILMTAGYHHLQLHNAAGMAAVWEEALGRLGPLRETVRGDFGELSFRLAWAPTAERLERLKDAEEDVDFEALWALPRPLWELP